MPAYRGRAQRRGLRAHRHGMAAIPDPRLAASDRRDAPPAPARRARRARRCAAPGRRDTTAHRGRNVSVRPFPLVLVSAWNDSGGGFVHRLFDGHPECFVWPFELQLGTAEQSDGFASWFRAKYRWPVLPSDAASAPPERLFDLFLDDEVKGYLRHRAASKFAAFDLDLSIVAWRAEFSRRLA